ncbi:dnaJ homolog subfamily C member 25 homolog [Branchiostoma floridae]|uniref:DnaJ homolog subfamily C member 25 n=1 Tax=Branchiostoma floridae TaxID=7739 RepID=C3YT47_BRAFL|nr:dnaJ homolog subfamily C member 25 homolog [Branchiostoma floridae]|eukprot:XP_002600402.1 hypothetical protein BRAFLDRAFT_284535 [Branchiostoma floridae]
MAPPRWKFSILSAILVVFFPVFVMGQIQGLYCGEQNCYDVLGLTREATTREIGKAYRQLALKFHPDRNKAADAEEKFTLIATAYETLRDEESRADYDDVLDNPEKYFQHYYRYYRRRVAPKVDVRIVIVVTLTVISVIQYLGWWHRYNQAISYLVTVPKYRTRAMDIAKEQGLINNKKKGRRSKEEIKQEEEAALKNVIENMMDIRGGYSKPSVYDVLWVKLVLFPYHAVLYLWWYAAWVWKFSVCKQPYGREEKMYLMRRNIGYTPTQWDAVEDSVKETYLQKGLWDRKVFLQWKKEQEEEMKAKLAEDPKYKRYRRWMKQGGATRMTFED